MALKELLSNLASGDVESSYSNYPSQNLHLEAITFNQRSFRFGDPGSNTFDRIGGEFSREPFIGNPRAKFGVTSDNLDLSDANDTLSGLEGTLEIVDGVTDGLVRGGLVTAIQRSVTDTQRLTNFYFSERGVGFLLKQTLLQTTNPAIEDGEAETFEFFSDITGLRRNRQFNPLGTNLLAQSLVNFSGTHFDRAGLLPIWPDERKYENVVRKKANDVGNLSTTSKKTNRFRGNRLLTLLEDRIKPHAIQVESKDKAQGSNDENEKGWLGRAWDQTKETFNDIFIKDDAMLYEYGAGPGSTYGIGRTSIRRFENTLTSPNLTATGDTRRFGDEFDGPTKAADITNYLNSLGRPSAVSADYQEDVPYGGKTLKLYRESNYGLGNPGVEWLSHTERNPHINQSTYNVYNMSTTDKINLLDIFKAEGNYDSLIPRDFIKFRFEAVNNDNPAESNVMVFRAFLDDLQDNYNSTLNEFTYNGRGETIYQYDKFKRDISFRFKVAAQTRHEMMPIYRKLNYLVSQTAPEYKEGRMRAGFVRLTIGSWCDRIPGFIQNISLSWQKDYPWEIAMYSAEDGDDNSMLVLPHVLDVKVSFLPVHNFTPQRSVTKSPFILPHENNGKLHSGQRWYESEPTKIETKEAEKPPFKKTPIPEQKENEIVQVDENPVKKPDIATDPVSIDSPTYDPLPESNTPSGNSKRRGLFGNGKGGKKHDKKKRGYPKLAIQGTGLRGKGSPKFRIVGAWVGKPSYTETREQHRRRVKRNGGLSFNPKHFFQNCMGNFG